MSSKWEKVLPAGFEPHKSVATALKIFAAARVPFALVGRIALWFYLPGHQQEYTKDVDFAVPYGYSEQAAQVAREMGYKVEKLSLGYGISGAGVLLDFIDHHPAFEILYLDAVKSARRHGGLPIVSKLHLATMKLGAKPC